MMKGIYLVPKIKIKNHGVYFLIFFINGSQIHFNLVIINNVPYMQ